MEEAKKIYAELCAEVGTARMDQATNGWKHAVIFDYMKEGILSGFIASLFEPAPAYID